MILTRKGEDEIELVVLVIRIVDNASRSSSVSEPLLGNPRCRSSPAGLWCPFYRYQRLLCEKVLRSVTDQNASYLVEFLRDINMRTRARLRDTITE